MLCKKSIYSGFIRKDPVNYATKHVDIGYCTRVVEDFPIKPSKVMYKRSWTEITIV